MKIHDVVFVYHLDEPRLMSWHSRVHHHEAGQYEFHYFIAGEGSFRNGDTTRIIEAGNLFLSLPGQVHTIIPRALGRPLTYYAVLFEFESGRDQALADLEDKRIADGFPLKLEASWRLRFADIKNRYNSHNAFFRMAAELELASFLLGLMGTILEGGSLPGERYQERDLHVAQAMTLFQDKVHENIRLSDVAESLGISETWLMKIFRDRVGISPARYFQQLKLEVAGSLLINTNLSVKEIAWRLSYSSPYHFSRNFTAHAGMNPTAWRHRHQAEQVVT